MDKIGDNEMFIHKDALNNNVGELNNYVIINAPEHLRLSTHLADSTYKRYISKIPVNGNANIYWELLNKFGENKKFGILLYNDSETGVNVRINKKSACSYVDVGGVAPLDYAPLKIWYDYYDDRIVQDSGTAIKEGNDTLYIAPGSSKWIYLDDIYGTLDSQGNMFNGIINLSVMGGKQLNCYALMFSESGQKQIEEDFNMYNQHGVNSGYDTYERAQTEEIIGGQTVGSYIAGSTDAPVLESGEINLTGKENYRLFLTGYDAPFINRGERTHLIYDGEEVKGESLGKNALNYSVIYKLNVKGFTGKMIMEFSPYVNPEYFSNNWNGIHVFAKCNEEVRSGKLTYTSRTLEMNINCAENETQQIDLVVSGMSALPVVVRFKKE